MAGDAVQALPLEVPEAVLGAAETVPQATWSGEARAPVPAPRFARLSEVLAERSAAAASAEEPRALARSTHPGAAPRAASRRPDAAAPPSPDPAARGPVPLAGSVPPRIVVHYRREAGPAAARRVASELLARGYARTELRPVAFAISRANVRYFHEQNRPVARDVNELVQATGSRSDLRDFTHYAPLPTVGTVEVWLPG